MDCNKEEAQRAKQLAEKKMEIKDFSGALKIAVKAQKLYPALENISQLIVVCEVHCSAEKKLYGTDKDWYGILKIEPTADDISIKKQYRKLALVLHPDKNKFSGSTDAFKLIGEAQRVLLDLEKRRVHDSKHRAFGNISSPSWIPKQPDSQLNAQHQHPRNHGHPVNFSGVCSGNFQFTQQRAPTGVGAHTSAFWTVCPFCSVRYQFYRDVLNSVIICHNCKRSFTAFELNPHRAPAAPTANKTQNRPRQNRVSPKPTAGATRTFTAKPVFEKKEPPKTQRNLNRKRRKRIEESSDSSESEENVEVHSVPKKVDKQPRRSSRSKRKFSYKENVHDVDNAENEAKKHVQQHNENLNSEFDDDKSQNDKQNSDHKGDDDDDDDDDDDIEEEIESEPGVFLCPDSEFNDFNKNRKEESFKVGQIWACYDTEDAMPRFYALIKKKSPRFKLQIQWLEPDPVTMDEKKWVEVDLPVSCGRFTLEKLDKTYERLSFSHQISWEVVPKIKTVSILPRKGDTWALFKNWSMNWYSSFDPSKGMKYEYEFVEILSDFKEKSGVRVSYLEKVKGFVSLFRRKEGGEMVIAWSEKYRFAHMVPSCRMSGEEKDGVPKGSYELDPASLPPSVFE